MKKVLFVVLFGYMIGTINPAYILGKRKGFDIRQKGSGNAGASNAVLLMGKKTGAACALFDILKAYVVYGLAEYWCPEFAAAGILAGAACIIGHMFPVWMHFRGGKGLASLGGVIFAYSPKVFGVILLVEIVLILIVDYICAAAISASVIFPLIYTYFEESMTGVLALAIVAAFMLNKHVENLQRIRQGREARVSYLWNKEGEIARLSANK